MLTHIKNIISKANKFAIGAFNTYNLETTKGIIQAAAKQKFPIIIQVSENAIQYAGLEPIAEIIKSVINEDAKNIPIALHLDHAKSFALIKQAIAVGFSSVMFDGSDLSFSENIKITKQIVDYAHHHDVWVQGEIGEILKGRIGVISPERRAKGLTKPDLAVEFVKKTGVNTLAVAIGNVHGSYKLFHQVPRLDINLLKEINKKIKIPLVLHGGSGINKKDIKETIKNGIKIININSELKLVFSNCLRKILKNNFSETDPRVIFAPAIKAVQKVAEDKIKLFRL